MTDEEIARELRTKWIDLRNLVRKAKRENLIDIELRIGRNTVVAGDSEVDTIFTREMVITKCL